MILFQIDGVTVGKTRSTKQRYICQLLEKLALENTNKTIEVVYSTSPGHVRPERSPLRSNPS
jgi:hypothetical protein